MIETGRVRDNYFRVVMEEPFRREHVSLDLSNEEGPNCGKCGGRMGKRKTQGISLVGSRNRKQDNMTVGCELNKMQEMRLWRWVGAK